MGEQFGNTEEINPREIGKDRLDVIIKRANDEYNNLFRSIEIGGKPVSFVMYTELQTRGIGLTEEMKADRERLEAMADCMKEEMEKLGINQEEADRYHELTIKQHNDPSLISEEEFDYICNYIRKIDKIFYALQEKEFNEEKFTAKEIRQ